MPTFVPFNFHWKEGVPPFVGVAVKITFTPEQMVVALAAMLTEGVAVELTVIVIALEVALAGLAQGIEEVMTTVTTSLLERDEF